MEMAALSRQTSYFPIKAKTMEDAEVRQFVRQLVGSMNEIQVELKNIRLSLEKINDSISEGVYLDWDEEE